MNTKKHEKNHWTLQRYYAVTKYGRHLIATNENDPELTPEEVVGDYLENCRAEAVDFGEDTLPELKRIEKVTHVIIFDNEKVSDH